jgi:molybdenum cofactor cytidylyltransferase
MVRRKCQHAGSKRYESGFHKMSDPVEGIILAAGLSTRMGVPKLWIEIEGLPLLMRVVRACLGSGLSQVTLISGPRDDEFANRLGEVDEHPRFRQLVNPHPELGMSSSLRAGISSVRAGMAGAMIVLGDQPWITSPIIDELVGVFRRDRERIVVPTIDGRRTTPVIFPADLFPDLMNTTGDRGGREVVNQFHERVVTVELGSQYDDADLDTPEDLERMRLNRSKERGRP